MTVEVVHEITRNEDLSIQEINLNIVKELRSHKDWEEVVAYENMSASARAHSLTATTLRGEGKVAKTPLKFFNKDKTKCVLICHFGINLCGHDGIIHGGFAATILDEMLAYITIPHLPNKSGFTANLNVDYRKPILANQWMIVRGNLEKLDGRKAWGRASVETLDGVLLTEATALYISPRSHGPITKF
ncbi:HotDog domain-containing protein [Sporodiniella umbellata]|nr:HotDog domain-containing protein [Sporodiniella umbellata]